MLLIDEAFISLFKFWRDEQIQQGMRFRDQLFRSVSCFDATQREQMFALSSCLVQAGQEVVVTTANARYTIWVCLTPPQRSQDCSTQSTMALNWNRLTQSVSA